MPKKYSKPPVRVEFSKRLRQLRTEHGFHTARSFALALKIDENRYTRYERAEVEPDLTRFVMMCHQLQITPNDLLGFHDKKATAAVAPDGHDGEDLLDGKSSMQRPALELAEAIVGTRKDGAASTLDRVTRIGQIVSDIVSDPFLFVGRKLGKLLPSDLDEPAVTRMGSLAEAVLDAAKREAMNSGNHAARRP